MFKQKVGLLDQDEKEALEGEKYDHKKIFTPLKDADENWVLPIKQIKNNKNINFWWVKYLPLIDYKPQQMDKSIIVDVAAFSGLFLFTGAEVAIESTIFEIISKFGVVAVLWFWLKEMKEQMKNQVKGFNEETEKLRNEHKNTMHEISEIHKEHKESLNEQLKAKDDIIKQLQK
jgi:hypothetical protein